MTFEEKLSIEINVKNIDMMAQAHGSGDYSRLPVHLCILSMIDAPIHHKSFLGYCVMQTKPDLKTGFDLVQEMQDIFNQHCAHFRSKGVQIINCKLKQNDVVQIARNSIMRVILSEDGSDKYWSGEFGKALNTYKHSYKTTFEWLTLQLKEIKADVIRKCNQELENQYYENIKQN